MDHTQKTIFFRKYSERNAEQLRGKSLEILSSSGFVSLEKLTQIGGHSNRVEALVA